MTDETLSQGKELKNKIASLQNVLIYMSKENIKRPIFIGRDGYNLTDHITPAIDTTIRALVINDLQAQIEELKKQFSEL